MAPRDGTPLEASQVQHFGSASGSRTIYVPFSESARRSRASALAILTETKPVHARALAELGARRANLRSGPRAVSDREAHELVAPAYEWWVNAHRDNPSDQKIWKSE